MYQVLTKKNSMPIVNVAFNLFLCNTLGFFSPNLNFGRFMFESEHLFLLTILALNGIRKYFTSFLFSLFKLLLETRLVFLYVFTEQNGNNY